MMHETHHVCVLLTIIIITVTSIIRAGSGLIGVMDVWKLFRAGHTLLNPATHPLCYPDDRVMALD